MCSHSVQDALLPINPLGEHGWDALVAAHPKSSFFHTSAWARVLTKTYGYSPAYFVTRTLEGLRSLLPLMEVDSWLTGRRGISLPFTDECSPLCSDETSFRRLFDAALELGKKRAWKFFEIRGGNEFLAAVPGSLSFYGHCLNLASDEERLFARFDSSVRRAIRKAEKEGVKVEISTSLEGIATFYSLQCQTRKKHGLPPQPFDFFRNIHDFVLACGLGVVIIARYQERPIASSVYFRLGDRAIYKYGASDESFQHLRGANLVMWQAVKWSASQGVKTLSFGRTSVANEGLRKFKLGWGVEEEEITYRKFDLRQGRFVSDADSAFGWYNRLFQVLPTFVSRKIGGLLYRHSA